MHAQTFGRLVLGITCCLAIAAICISLFCFVTLVGQQNGGAKMHIEENSSKIGWVKILSSPDKYDGCKVRIRGVFATRSGYGTGGELWLAEWAKFQGQRDMFIHIQEESMSAFFGGSRTAKANQLDGSVVEIEGFFLAHSVESMTGDIYALGQITYIMLCNPSESGSRGGEILTRPDAENRK